MRCLASVQVPLSIRQVGRQAGLSHVSTASVLDDLVGMGLVAATVAGRSRVHWLERRNLYVEHVVLPALAAVAVMPETVVAELRAAMPEGVVSAVLFGSHARGEQTPLSDVDLLVVAETETAVETALAHFDSRSTELRARLGARVSVLGHTLQSAVKLQGQGDNLMGGVARDGIVVAGLSPHEWGEYAEGQTNREA